VLADDDLRASCSLIAYAHDDSCADGAASAYAEMKKAAVSAQFFCSQADGSQGVRRSVTLQHVLKAGVDMFVIDAVEKLANRKIRELNQSRPPGSRPEDIETMLRYQTRLRPLLADLRIHLELPNTGMRYAEVSGVTEGDLAPRRT
jgi:hypothetical protein